MAVSKGPPAEVARISNGITAVDEIVRPDDASAGAGAIYVTDPLKLEQLFAG